MKLKIIFLVMLVLALIFNGPASVLAQSGCSEMPPMAEVRYTVVNSYQLSPYIPEVNSVNVPATFHRNRLEGIVRQPDEAVLVASNSMGTGELCGDDVFRWESEAGVIELSFSSADRNKINPRSVQNISALFPVGQATGVTISYIDHLPPKYSASPVWLVVVKADPAMGLPPPVPVTPHQPVVSAPAGNPSNQGITEPEEMPATESGIEFIVTTLPDGRKIIERIVETPTSDAETAVTATPALIVMVAPDPTALEVDTSVTAPPAETTSSGWPWEWIGLVLLGGVGLWIYGSRLRTETPPGGWDIHFQGQYQRTLEFAGLKKAQIRAGSDPGGEVVLAGDEIAPVAIRVVSQTGEQGQRQAVYEILDPEAPEEVVERYVLEPGDEHRIGDYKLIYFTYQADKSFYERSEDDD
jgi:hypothetical protein